MLRGVKFGKYHTVEDWGLILNSKNVEVPKVKTTFVSIQDRDGLLDMSEALTGEIKYDARTLAFTFLLTDGDHLHRERLIRQILVAIHGKRMNITLDDDIYKYFVGRVEVVSYTNNNAYGTIQVDATCDPYKLSIYDVAEAFELTSTESEIELENWGDKTVVPTVTTTSNATIKFNNTTVKLTKGVHLLDGLVLKAGKTSISVSGNGTLTIGWKEGYL